MVNSTDTLAFKQHDHSLCIDSALNTARQLCLSKGLRLTPIREKVFYFICQSHKPLGAYAILDLLVAADKDSSIKSKRLAPPTVYRALDFLQTHQLIHRIATLNAYISCCRPARSHQSQFLICRQCDTTVEFTSPSICNAIDDSALHANFSIESVCLEIIGLCPYCQHSEPELYE